MAASEERFIVDGMLTGSAFVEVVAVRGLLVVFATVVGVECLLAPRGRAAGTVCLVALCVVVATATDPVAATKSKTARNQAVCKRFIRASPSERGSCHVQ
jgi:hypothetical protein